MPERWTKALTHTRPIFRNDTLTICFLGDMMLHTKQIENAHRGGSEYDFSSYFFHLEDRIAEADIAVANMEFTLAGEPYTGYPAFSAPDSYAEYLADCGFDIFLCANNHIFDKGSQGASRTIEKYRELGISHGIKYCGLAADQAHPLIFDEVVEAPDRVGAAAHAGEDGVGQASRLGQALLAGLP